MPALCLDVRRLSSCPFSALAGGVHRKRAKTWESGANPSDRISMAASRHSCRSMRAMLFDGKARLEVSDALEQSEAVWQTNESS